MQVIPSLNSTINYMNCGKDVNQYPSCHNLIVKSATLAPAQSADKTCDWMAKDDYRNLAGGGGGGQGRGGGSCWYLLSDEPLSARDVITQHH